MDLARVLVAGWQPYAGQELLERFPLVKPEQRPAYVKDDSAVTEFWYQSVTLFASVIADFLEC